MAGRFHGLTDAQWQVLSKFLPPPPVVRKRGKPRSDFRQILNTIFWVLVTGCRWADVPRGSEWGTRSSSHRWLGIWQEDGTWANLVQCVLGVAELAGMISWERASIDGSFAAGKGGGEGVEYGFKGKGVTIHALTDGQGMPLALTHTGAAGNERDQVTPLMNGVSIKTGKPGRTRKRPKVLQMDKGYDSQALRKKNP